MNEGQMLYFSSKNKDFWILKYKFQIQIFDQVSSPRLERARSHDDVYLVGQWFAVEAGRHRRRGCRRSLVSGPTNEGRAGKVAGGRLIQLSAAMIRSRLQQFIEHKGG